MPANTSPHCSARFAAALLSSAFIVCAQTTVHGAETNAGANATEFAAAARADELSELQLIVEDGQLRSHPFLVFVTSDVQAAMKPRLMLRGAGLALPGSATENGRLLTPLRVVPNQLRLIEIDGVRIPVRGSLLIFDLGNYQVKWFKSGVRLLPLLEWTETAPDGKTTVNRQAAAPDEIFLGNMVGATFWTIMALVAVFGTLLLWSHQKSRKITAFEPRPGLLLITGPDGYLSLWRTQLLLWTFAVCGVVGLFGLVRLHVPEIPETLVALMGMSLLTGGLSATRSRKDSMTKIVRGKSGAARETVHRTGADDATEKVRGSWADLIASWNDVTQQVELSVPKAQMVIWTVFILGLFIVKSILEGALWEIPWQLVALTGVSQAGYVGDKYVKSMVPVNR